MKTFRKSFIKNATQKKAIIGMVMAFIMVASVLVAMVPIGIGSAQTEMNLTGIKLWHILFKSKTSRSSYHSIDGSANGVAL